MKKSFTLFFLFTIFALTVFSQSLSFTPDITISSDEEIFAMGAGAEGKYALDDNFTSRLLLDFAFNSKHFGFLAATSFRQDGVYAPDIANTPDGTLFNSYFTLDQGAMILKALDMELQLGRILQKDAIDSPYSLFISSKPNTPLLANFRYENSFAFYETRWIELNTRSGVKTEAFSGGFPDRGAQLKTYGIKLGNMRFGLQDGAVYTGRSFDLEYFVNPIPNYLIQYVKGTEGRPWTTGDNENDIMGLFWDWKPNENLSFNAQLFVDDMSLLGIGNTSRNPWKTAYSLGGTIKTNFGSFSLHHALATKYCFSTTSDRKEVAYPWAYYPDTRFPIKEGDYRAIPFETLMIGYYNGENNIAFRLDYENDFHGFKLLSNLEFVLSGDKSPGNAWHAGTWYVGPGTRLFDSEYLEKKFILSGQLSKQVHDFTFFSNFLIGFAINALELQRPYPEGSESGVSEVYKDIDENVWIWRAGKSNELYFTLSLGFRYAIPIMNLFNK